ncbi:MAG: peptidoglycan DD-metalloendopeptidase family protein [Betaproteobacteria bacterium]
MVIAVLAAGCASRTPAPIVERATVPPLPPPTVAPPMTPQLAVVPSPPTAPVAPPTYIVKRGDTLRQIALEHGVDVRELAAWNNLENVNLIRVGQALRLTAPGSEAVAATASTSAAAAAGTTTTPLRTAPPIAAGEARPTSAPIPSRASDGLTRSGPKAIKEPWSEQAMREVARSGGGLDALIAKVEPSLPAPPPVTPIPPAGTPATATAPATPSTAGAAPAPSPGDDEGLDWVWPAKGRLVAQFSEGASLKGIDIGGANGDAVVASAPGRVVYAGSGLRGYGKLVIIKHNATYLTAYAHNRDILVKEGQSVARGQKIAEMGSSDADRVKLHFEIRRLGKPMDPLRFLPPA